MVELNLDEVGLGVLEVLDDSVDKRLGSLRVDSRENELLVDSVFIVDNHHERRPLVDTAKRVLTRELIWGVPVDGSSLFIDASNGSWVLGSGNHGGATIADGHYAGETVDALATENNRLGIVGLYAAANRFLDCIRGEVLN